MLDYARISKMLEYQRRRIWPLNRTRPSLKALLKDAVRLVRARGPVSAALATGPEYSVFRIGTRGWEYPWVQEQLPRLPAGAKILDCGCGMSGFPEELARQGFKPAGLDFLYFLQGYGSGFEKFGSYHRLTSVGFVLVKS